MSKLNVNQISSLSGGNISLDGQVTGTSASFSGNVSIGGSLTFNKVTNVDSVGLITAKNGIQVLANGINATGVITATSFSGDGSQLSNISGGGEFDFVASGTIPNGQTVVINTDGTVGIVTGSSTPISPGTAIAFSDFKADYISATYDTNANRVVIAWMDKGASTTNYGTAVVGNVVGTGITFGTPVVFESANTSWFSAVYDSSNQKVVIAYSVSSVSGKAIVGTVDPSNNSISFGSASIFANSNIGYTSATYDSDHNRVVIAWRDQDSSNNLRGKAIVGTVSGTSITFPGSEVTFNSTDSHFTGITYDPSNQQVVIAYQNTQLDSNNNYTYHPTAIVGNVTGASSDTLNFGNPTTIESILSGGWLTPIYDPTSQKIVIFYSDYTNSKGKASVGTIVGTGITFGTPVIFESANHVGHNAPVYDTSSNKLVNTYCLEGNAQGKSLVATVVGTGITFGTAVNVGYGAYQTATYDSSNNKIVTAYRHALDGLYLGKSIVVGIDVITTNLTAGNYIGIAKNSIADGATGKINIPTGINTSQSGLTTGRTYYIQPNGTLATTAGNPSVVAGTSISDTDLLIK